MKNTIKALIKKETYFFPAIAVGLRDLAGSGEFGSEYIVATKRYRNFDFSNSNLNQASKVIRFSNRKIYNTN